MRTTYPGKTCCAWLAVFTAMVISACGGGGPSGIGTATSEPPAAEIPAESFPPDGTDSTPPEDNAPGETAAATTFAGCGAAYERDYTPVTGLNANPIPQLAEPAKGTVFFDPTYGTCLVRATDHASEPPNGFARNDYSRRQAFNADASRFIVYALDGYWHLYDGETLAHLKALNGPAADAEIQWHASNPDLLHYMDPFGGLRIYTYNVVTDEVTVAADFTGLLPWPTAARAWTKSEGSPSADGRYWGFQVETADFDPLGLMVWDMQTSTVVGTWDFASNNVGRPDHVSMSPSGEYLVASWDGNAYGTSAFPRDFSGAPVPLHHKSEHSDLALLPNGQDAYISVDYQSNAGDVFMVNLQTGVKTVLFPSYVNGTATAFHFSGKAYAKPGWVVVSTYASGAGAEWLHNKVFALELKADPTLVHLAHTQVAYNGYWTEPHASVSRDFTRILFNSNWRSGDDEDVDAYLIGLPAGAF